MDADEATATARQILGQAMAAMVDPRDPALVLDRAAVADTEGRAPGATGWNPSYDPFVLAAELADLLGVRATGQDGILTVTSEGSTFTKRTADFFAVAAAIRAKSSKPTGVGVIEIDTGMRKNDTFSGDGYVTWDGDLPELHDWRSPCL